MSRSYKHTPVVTDRSGRPGSAKYFKRQANRKVRHTFDVPNGKAYRRVYNPWNIRDYIFYWPQSYAVERYNRYYDIYGNQSLEEYINKVWKKYYFRK